MIHKYLAGMIDQYQLAGDGQALEVAVRLGDWVDRRTSRYRGELLADRDTASHVRDRRVG